MNPHIFRAYDIRGIAQSDDGTEPDLTEESIYSIGKATGIYLQKNYKTKTIAVGRDVRTTGPGLQKAYMKGLLETGLDVTDIGMVTSPMAYWTTCALDFDAGTSITASHNPKQYNGLKIFTKNAHSICGDELQKIYQLTTAQSSDSGKSVTNDGKYKQNNAPLRTRNIWPQYLKDLTSRIHPTRPLKIVVDAGNGAAGPFAKQFIENLASDQTGPGHEPPDTPHKVVELYCEPDGDFPNHESNPEELKNMQDLIAKVKETNADLGIGFDGDGDRIGVVDEKGRMYSSDFMLLLLVRDITKRIKNPKIVFDVKVSQAIINDMKKHGATPIMSRTGHSFIEAKMKKIGSPLGGETSGHLFFGENYYGFDDAFFAAAKIIEILSKEDKPLSELFKDLPKTHTTPEIKAHCPDNKKFRVVEALVKHFTANYDDCITIDGVRINFSPTDWAAIRASNTSPNLTLRFEAKTPEKLREIQQIMIEQLRLHHEVDTSRYKITASAQK